MKPHLQYLSYVLRHKWYVFWACLKLGVPLWRAIIHDYSKFSPAEWGPYVRRFYGPKPPQLGATGYQHRPGNDPAFDEAWAHHWKHNPHHWNYWAHYCPGEQMPETYVREMVADWRGAGLAQGKDDLREWYRTNREHRVLHPETQRLVEWLIDEVLQ
jgi:hypothetical protein